MWTQRTGALLAAILFAMPLMDVSAQPAGAGQGNAWPSLPSMAPLVEAVQGAVVSVEVVTRGGGGMQSPFIPGLPEDPLERFFGGPSPDALRQGLGSGFIVDASGWVLTNFHVVEGATAIRVRLNDGRMFDAQVKGRDPLTDLALLQLQGQVRDLPAVRFGNSDAIEVGDWLVAIGSPFGLNTTVSTGILSARARDIGAGPYDEFLQTDAAINPGNSGGPLFNLQGEVVGMNTAIVGGGTGIGFAVPSNLIQALVPQLRREGSVTRGWLGVQLQELTPELAKALSVPTSKGAIVTQVLPDSPAQKAQLKADDVITQVNGKPVVSASALTRQVALMRPNDELRLELYRGGKREERRLRLAVRPDFEGVKEAQTPEQAQDTKQRYGFTVADIPPQLSQVPGAPNRGALITDVRPASPADRADLAPGMVVTEVSGQQVNNAQELAAHLQRAKKGDTLLLRVRAPEGDAQFLRALTVP